MEKRLVVLAVVLAISMFGAGFAASLVITQDIPSQVNVVVRYGRGPIRAYWDFDKTTLVETIDFGDVLQGDTAHVTFYIFNENATYAANVTWSSTIGTATLGKITDWFSPNIQYQDLEPGDYFWVDYSIQVAADTPVGPYDWILSLGAQV